jgi:hypothetical protein
MSEVCDDGFGREEERRIKMAGLKKKKLFILE